MAAFVRGRPTLPAIGAVGCGAWAQRFHWSAKMLDINGFLTSTEFVAQIAAIFTAVFSAIFGQFLAGLFSGGA